jgi:predicted nicotinamide N-methyase
VKCGRLAAQVQVQVIILTAQPAEVFSPFRTVHTSMAGVTVEPDGGTGVVLLRIGQRASEWCFEEDVQQLLAATLPPLPDGRHVRLHTLPHLTASTGTRVWHSAPVMCRWLGEYGAWVRGGSVLELGAGTGACGIYAAALGAARALLTDGGPPELLALLSHNVCQNRELLAAGCEVETRELAWGCEPMLLPGGHFDLILGSDLIYEIASHEPLCTTLSALLRRQARPPRVLLATMPRKREQLPSELMPLEHLQLFSDAATIHFSRMAASHGLRLAMATAAAPMAAPGPQSGGMSGGGSPLQGSRRGGPHDTCAPDEPFPRTLCWTATTFRDAEPFVFEILLRPTT